MAAAITATCSVFSSRAGMTETATGGLCQAPVRLRYGKSARMKPMKEMTAELRKKSMTLSRTAPSAKSGITTTRESLLSSPGQHRHTSRYLLPPAKATGARELDDPSHQSNRADQHNSTGTGGCQRAPADFHNAASAGCRHYLRRRIDNRAALKVRRMVSATASA